MAEGGGSSLLPAPENAVEMKVFQGGGLSPEGGGTTSLLEQPSATIPMQVFKGGGQNNFEAFLTGPPESRENVKFRGLTLDELVKVIPEINARTEGPLDNNSKELPILLVEIVEKGNETPLYYNNIFQNKYTIFTISSSIYKDNLLFDKKSTEEILNSNEKYSNIDLSNIYIYDPSDGKEFTKGASSLLDSTNQDNKFHIFVFNKNSNDLLQKSSLFIDKNTITNVSVSQEEAIEETASIVQEEDQEKKQEKEVTEVPTVTTGPEGASTLPITQEVLISEKEDNIKGEASPELSPITLPASPSVTIELPITQQAESIQDNTEQIKQLKQQIQSLEQQIPSSTSQKLIQHYKSKITELQKQIESLKTKPTATKTEVELQEAIQQIKELLPEDHKELFVSKMGGERAAGIISSYLLKENGTIHQEELDQLQTYLTETIVPISFLNHKPGTFLPTTPLFQKAYNWYLVSLTEKVLGNIAANSLKRRINGKNVKSPTVISTPATSTTSVAVPATSTTSATSVAVPATSADVPEISTTSATSTTSGTPRKRGSSMVAIKQAASKKQEKTSPQVQEENPPVAGTILGKTRSGRLVKQAIRGGSRNMKKHVAKTRRINKSTNGAPSRVRTSRKARSKQID